MLKVYLTVDVEIWCDGWDNLDSKFNDAFQNYIYGSTEKGAYGLPFQLNVLNNHGLKGVFFVEPLFSLRFGSSPLSEVVGLITEANQAVELHLHTEWVDEAKTPPLPNIVTKRQHLRYFTQPEQEILISLGRELLAKAGARKINAFRAGSFGFNKYTLSALRNIGIPIDSSYNATQMGLDSGLVPGHILNSPLTYDGVYEVPLTVYYDRPNHLRHVQLCACSSRELEGILWKSLKEGRREVAILSHSFELLDRSFLRKNPIVTKRFLKLCEFLDENRAYFSVENFSNYSYNTPPKQHPPLASPVWKTGLRIIEQARSRFA